LPASRYLSHSRMAGGEPRLGMTATYMSRENHDWALCVIT
jgi:superfamily II DNA or RNA helicase